MASSTQLPPGTIIADKYELEGLLGEGGMGAVYQATNLAIGRRVAIKILHASIAEQDDVRHRFELEARAAAVISHPGIVDVLDMGQTEEGDPFIVMEHLEGVTLRSLVKERGRLTVAESIGVMVPVLEALSAAHRAGVIHRDVKPANIFVCARPQLVKLLDFGVSRFGESSGLTRTGTAIGTPRYMAPEQVLGEHDLGPEADLYSVGAVLYSLLSGKLPHGTGSDTAVLARILHDTPAPLATHEPTLPPELCALVDALLSKDRAKRPKDALAVRDALQKLVPEHDLSALFSAAAAHAREAALAPTPSTGSQANLPRVKRTKTAPSSPRVPAGEPTRESRPSRSGARSKKVVAPAPAPPPPKSNTGVVIAATLAGVAVLGLVGVGAWVALKPPPAPAQEPQKPAAVDGPVAPKPVVVTIAAEPASARIVVGGVDLGCNPCQLQGEAGSTREVKVMAAGMTETTLSVTLDKDRTEHVVLSPVAVAVAPTEEVDAGTPRKRSGKPGKPKPGELSVDEKNPYE
ncbi:MAG: serine/threonine-protein kinase [Myxococcota bacterium]